MGKSYYDWFHFRNRHGLGLKRTLRALQPVSKEIEAQELADSVDDEWNTLFEQLFAVYQPEESPWRRVERLIEVNRNSTTGGGNERIEPSQWWWPGRELYQPRT